MTIRKLRVLFSMPISSLDHLMYFSLACVGVSEVCGEIAKYRCVNSFTLSHNLGTAQMALPLTLSHNSGTSQRTLPSI